MMKALLVLIFGISQPSTAKQKVLLQLLDDNFASQPTKIADVIETFSKLLNLLLLHVLELCIKHLGTMPCASTIFAGTLGRRLAQFKLDSNWNAVFLDIA